MIEQMALDWNMSDQLKEMPFVEKLEEVHYE